MNDYLNIIFIKYRQSSSNYIQLIKYKTTVFSALLFRKPSNMRLKTENNTKYALINKNDKMSKYR